MRGVEEFAVGDEVVIKYNDGSIECDVYGTITKKWWSNRWDLDEPSDEQEDQEEQWFYDMVVDHTIGANIVDEVVKMCMAGRTHKCFLIRGGLKPRQKLTTLKWA
jgi:hypothetical protein